MTEEQVLLLTETIKAVSETVWAAARAGVLVDLIKCFVWFVVTSTVAVYSHWVLRTGLRGQKEEDCDIMYSDYLFPIISGSIVAVFGYLMAVSNLLGFLPRLLAPDYHTILLITEMVK